MLTQLVSKPTFSKNILDLVIPNDPTRIYQVHHGPPLGSTLNNQLHCTLTWDFFLRNERTISTGITKRNYMKGNYELLSGLLSETLTRPFDFNVNETYDSLVSTYKSAIDKCIPLTKVSGSTNKTNPKWFNSRVKRATSLKYKLYRKLISSLRNIELKHLYSSACKNVKVLVKATIIEYEVNLIKKCKTSPKLLYSYINGQKSCKEYIRTLSHSDGSLTSDKNEIVNLLNYQFCHVFNPTKIYRSTAPFNPVITHNCTTDRELFSIKNISKAIDNLNIHKSAGPDGIQPLIIKRCSHVFAQVLSNIFKKSFYSGIVPETWKEANITPIHKKDNKTDPANYRPISLTVVPCKMMERMIRDVMMNHLIKNKLIAEEQHSFVLNKSCLTNLLETIDIASQAIDEGNRILVIFLDFAKAFDKVCHESLHSKLMAYRFSEDILAWIRSFLSNRKQRVVIGDVTSSWKPVTSGVPQGSVLGPLLFVMFINDMPTVVRHMLKLFADDSKLIGIIRNTDDISILQVDLDALVEREKDWSMLFHPDKCKVMEISKSNQTKNSRIILSMEKNDSFERHTLDLVAETKSEKDLGIFISNDLKFDQQVKHAAAKATQVLGQLNRTFKYWTPSTFKTLYVSYVRPHLEYGAPTWSPYRIKDIKTLELVQRRATKLVTHLKNLDYSERLIALNLTTLEERRTRGDLIQFYKYFTGINIINFQSYPIGVNSRNQNGPAAGLRRNTHSLARLSLTTCAQRENYFLHRTIPKWNTLPNEIVSANSVNQFKNLLDRHLDKQRVTTTEARRLGKISF